jgi:acyl dehydratase
MTSTFRAEGPYFDELELGQEFASAPAYTLTDGRAATHQVIVGDRMRLPLDDVLSHAVTGRAPIAHPAFVWDVAIGQSTVATHHVKANLFYRHLTFHRLPAIGDTLSTRTTVVGLRENRRKEGRAPTGLAALRMITTDQRGDVVLDFYRCAMLPLRGIHETGRDDDLDVIGSDRESVDPLTSVAGWDLAALRSHGPRTPLEAGATFEVVGGDVVSSAPELARLTLNVARVHHDASAAGGRRLVYGGHTIGIAVSQVTRALPGLVTVLGWQGCDHTGPVHEGDTLASVVEVVDVEPGEHASVVRLRVLVRTVEDERPVLDWRFTALVR